MKTFTKPDFHIGAVSLSDDRCAFSVWAPELDQVEVHLLGPKERMILLKRDALGYHRTLVGEVPVGSRYVYKLNDALKRPDPASRFQPEGVHRSSQVVSSDYAWEDVSWRGLSLEELIIYELHVGTYTPEGTFASIVAHLDDLKSLGVNAIELMPVAQFSGNRNWGYDGTYPFAVQNSYGGPQGLKALVNACHTRGLAVILDVVYNHIGPEGNYLRDFGPYFTDRYQTPWGSALNFDGAHSDEVKRFFIENALYWVRDFHIDGLRLDAIHGILDRSADPFLRQLAEAVHQFGAERDRYIHLIPESDLNDARIICPVQKGGCGLDAQWNDDFHHALHTLLVGEQNGYYQDYGKVAHLAKAWKEGYVYTGQYSRFRKRSHGNTTDGLGAQQFIVFSQNHDQIGNRTKGERLTDLVSFEKLKLAAVCTLLSGFVPLLFMGEEYGETAPFLYFVSHSDRTLIQAVRKGREQEFQAFGWKGEVPDPQDEHTFITSRLNHHLKEEDPHKTLRAFYQELMLLRKTHSVLQTQAQTKMAVPFEEEQVLVVRKTRDFNEACIAINFGKRTATVSPPLAPGDWKKIFDSQDPRWRGDGQLAPQSMKEAGSMTLAPTSAVLFLKGSPAGEDV
jgi:maltooligosyltrehalose trehalohydrolase